MMMMMMMMMMIVSSDRYYILLAEVKSTSDSQSEMLKTSNAREVKDQKRSALNQLRRHREVLAQQLDIGERALPAGVRAGSELDLSIAVDAP